MPPPLITRLLHADYDFLLDGRDGVTENCYDKHTGKFRGAPYLVVLRVDPERGISPLKVSESRSVSFQAGRNYYIPNQTGCNLQPEVLISIFSLLEFSREKYPVG
jgi:hypothetical protein